MSPPPLRSRRAGRAPRKGRRVTRVVRRVELWSVTKVALVFNTVMMVIALGAVVLLWALASTTGLVEDLEGFLRESGFQDFRFDGGDMFSRVIFIGAIVALASTVFAVLAAALVNLISEITGGIRFVVIEEIVPAAAPAPSAAPAVPVGAASGPPSGTPGHPAVVRPPASGSPTSPPVPAAGRRSGSRAAPDSAATAAPGPPTTGQRPGEWRKAARSGQAAPARRASRTPVDAAETSPWLADGPFDVEAEEQTRR